MHFKTTSTIGLAMLVLFAPFAVAETLAVGALLPELTLPDQHGTTQTSGDATVILLAPDRESGAIAHQVLMTESDGLDAKGIVYISDISGMPSLVTNMFALPKMRDYPYRVLLGYEETDTQILPRRAGKVSVLRLQNGIVEQIGFAESAEALADMIGIGIAMD